MHSRDNGISIAKFKSKVLINLNISYLYHIRPSKYLITCIIDVLQIYSLKLVHIPEKKISLLIRRDSKINICNVFLKEKRKKYELG